MILYIAMWSVYMWCCYGSQSLQPGWCIIRKNSGSKRDPCRMPDKTGSMFDVVPPRTALCFTYKPCWHSSWDKLSFLSSVCFCRVPISEVFVTSGLALSIAFLIFMALQMLGLIQGRCFLEGRIFLGKHPTYTIERIMPSCPALVIIEPAKQINIIKHIAGFCMITEWIASYFPG